MFELYLAADKPPHPAISTDSQGILPYLDTFDTATVTRQHGSCVVPVDVSETMSNTHQKGRAFRKQGTETCRKLRVGLLGMGPGLLYHLLILLYCILGDGLDGWN